MAYNWTDSKVGNQPVTTVDDTQKHPIGMSAIAYDPTYGEGVFVYMPGVANVVAGDVVAIDTDAGTTTRAVLATRGPLAVAMAAVDSTTEYGWFQVSGAAVVSCAAAVAAGTPAYLTATAGEVDDAATAGSLVDGMVFKTADGTPAAGFAVAQIAYPCASGAA